MRYAFILLVIGALIGAACVALTMSGGALHAAQAFLTLLGSSIAIGFLREFIIARIDTTNGNDIGLIAQMLFLFVCLIATVAATLVAVFFSSSGVFTGCAVGAVALAAAITAGMHR